MEAQASYTIDATDRLENRPLWAAVDAMIDRSPSLADLREHRLHLLAARRWRLLGRPVPAELGFEERATAVVQLAAKPLLERVRAAIDGPMLVIKGPEASAAYPEPGLRPYGDIDLLVEDAEAARLALLEAGFEEVGDPALYVGIHHVRPLAWGGLPLHIELHKHLKWLDGGEPPDFRRLVGAAVPASVGVQGIQALSRADHAVALMVHSWAHEPLRMLSELVDVAAVGWGVEPSHVQDVANEWGVGKLWRNFHRATETVLFGTPPSWHLRTWAPSVLETRRRTVLETHLEPLLSPFAVSSPGPALAAAVRAGSQALRPAPSETWSRKLRRTRLALGAAFSPRSGHESDLEERELL
jgi:hypothetical protein